MHPRQRQTGSNRRMTAAAGSADGRLLAAFREGRRGAFEAIVRRHYTALLRVAEQRCGVGALAEDAVQAALVRAHKYLRGSGHVDNLGAWLRRIVYNCSTDLVRVERGRAPLPLAPGMDLPARRERRLEHKELRHLVADAIEQMPEIYRAPLRMCTLFGLEAKEIAAQLGDNIHSIKSRIARGRRELRRRLAPTLRKAGYL